MFRNVEFLSEGATIRGRLYLRSEGRPRGSLSNKDGSRQHLQPDGRIPSAAVIVVRADPVVRRDLGSA